MGSDYNSFMKSSSKLLREINTAKEKSLKKQDKDYKQSIGISDKCKTCNSDLRDEIELLYEQGNSYQEILNKLNLNGEISLQSLSRHFNNHYPKYKQYKDKKLKLQMATVQKTIKLFPELK